MDSRSIACERCRKSGNFLTAASGYYSDNLLRVIALCSICRWTLGSDNLTSITLKEYLRRVKLQVFT